MRKIIKEPMDRSEARDGESFWVLQEPGTEITIMSYEDGIPQGPITFKSEEDAIKFCNLYDVPHRMVPVHHTFKLRKGN
jgi:hypothetical protein